VVVVSRRIRPIDVEPSGDGLRWTFVLEHRAHPDVRVTVRTTTDLRRVVDVQTDNGHADHVGWPDDHAERTIRDRIDAFRVLAQLQAIVAGTQR
jgi:hypothetical protein